MATCLLLQRGGNKRGNRVAPLFFFLNSTNAMLQSIVPDELRGRVMSIYMLDRGLTPIGALLAGLGSHFFGAPDTVTAMGSIVIIMAILVAWRVPQLRSIESG